jgi:cellulose biosynthesis protein BcsQ
MKVLYVILICALFTLAVVFIPFFSHLSDYFAKANSLVQLFILLFLFVSVIASVLFAFERGHRVDALKEENCRLTRDLNNLGSQLITMQADWEEKLKTARHVNEQLESRWNALADVEARQNIWQRPFAAANSPFVSAEQRRSRTRFLSVINLKGGVGKTTLTANLAACLAVREQPLRVLIVDLDFQGSLSNHTVDPQLVQIQTANRNTVGRLLDSGFDARYLNGLLTPMFKVPGAKVVLANDELESVDYRLQAEYFVKSDREVRFLFRQHLHCPTVFQQFDLVIFDCPPRLTTSAINALACSDFVLIPTKLDQDSIISVPRTIKWLDLLAGVVSAQLVGVVANDVSVRAGKLTQADQNSYNYLGDVVAQWRAGNREFVFQSKIKSDPKIPPCERGVAACVEETPREFFRDFVGELTRRINL